jgi:hypothetical protein
MAVASVTTSFPAKTSHAEIGECSAGSTESFRFHGHTLWEMCRYIRFEIPLLTGCFTSGKSTG